MELKVIDGTWSGDGIGRDIYLRPDDVENGQIFLEGHFTAQELRELADFLDAKVKL